MWNYFWIALFVVVKIIEHVIVRVFVQSYPAVPCYPGWRYIIMLALPLKLLKKWGAKVLKIAVFDNPTVVWCPSSGNPREYPINLIIIARNYSHCATSSPLIERKTHVFWNSVRNGSSRSSTVVDFGTNRKRVCDFIWAINSNLGRILPRFRDIAGILLQSSPPPFHPNFEVFPWD